MKIKLIILFLPILFTKVFGQTNSPLPSEGYWGITGAEVLLIDQLDGLQYKKRNSSSDYSANVKLGLKTLDIEIYEKATRKKVYAINYSRVLFAESSRDLSKEFPEYNYTLQIPKIQGEFVDVMIKTYKGNIVFIGISYGSASMRFYISYVI